MTLVGLSTRMNPIVGAVLRSRAHWLLSRGLMLITVTGRKTGRTYTIPVGYLPMDDAIVILVNEAPSKVWWRNYLEPGPIGLRLRGKRLRATAEALRPDSAEFRERANASLRRARFMPRLFGIDFDARAGLTDAQVKLLGERIAIVRVSSVAPAPSTEPSRDSLAAPAAP
jgi:deazaflavin-dependent oxidoreductase (nitroreductase family)